VTNCATCSRPTRTRCGWPGRAVTLAEFLAGRDYEPPHLDRRALVQVHCHHGAVLGYDSEKELLGQMGLDVTIPDSGCCGMAGSFGFERGQRYEVSQACGERVILPAVRAAPEDTVVIADGFSCREQIGQATDRRPLHLAQVLRLAAGNPTGQALPEEALPGQARPEQALPEQALPEQACWQPRPRSGPLLAVLADAALGAAGGAAVIMSRRFSGGSHG